MPEDSREWGKQDGGVRDSHGIKMLRGLQGAIFKTQALWRRRFHLALLLAFKELLNLWSECLSF